MSSHLEMAGTWRAGESQLSQVLCSDDLGGRTGYDEEHGEEHQAIEQAQHQQRHEDQKEVPENVRECYFQSSKSHFCQVQGHLSTNYKSTSQKFSDKGLTLWTKKL